MLKHLLEGIRTRIEQTRPALTLFQRHRPTMRTWARYQRAVAETLGDQVAASYTELILAVADIDGNTARILAHTLPDQLPRVKEAHQESYFELLHKVLQEATEPLPLVARTLPELLESLEISELEHFLRQGVALYRQSHQQAESFLRQESTTGQTAALSLKKGTSLEEVSRVMTLYARAHCGEDVQIRPGQGQSFSDGHHIYLPERISRFEDSRDFINYRVLTAINAGYLEFGTFDLRLDQLPAPAGGWPEAHPGESEVERFFRAFPQRTLARDLFQILEDVRIETSIRKEYPGVARDLDLLGDRWDDTPPVQGDPTVARALAALRGVVHHKAIPELSSQEQAAIGFFLKAIEGIRAQDSSVLETALRVQEGYAGFSALLKVATPGPPPSSSNPQKNARGPSGNDVQPPANKPPPPARSRIRPEAALPEDREVEEEARRQWSQDQKLEPGEARKQVRDARRSNPTMLGETTQKQPPGGAWVPKEEEPEAPIDRPQRPVGPRFELDPDLAPGEKQFWYREWDCTIGDYKPRWVTVRERMLKEGSPAVVEEILQRHRHRVVDLKRRFEALRPQAVVRKTRLTDGSDLDLDRVIEDRINARAGGERTDRLYAREDRARRDVAVAFLLDMSSSTNESSDGSPRRIIDVERESLILTAEAIHTLGDPFAIFGFSGYGRQQVAFYVAKDFTDPWNASTQSRVGRMNFKMENRDGAAIRHATARLLAWPARTRILIVLSDGKPLDCGCDHYYDKYAQEDCRIALREARQVGVHPFCITVDPQARSYLPTMFGEVAYTVIDRVELLPGRLIHVYRRLAI